MTNKVYGCQVRRRDYLQRREGGGFDAEEYDANPELYMSTFGKMVNLFLFNIQDTVLIFEL